MWSVIQVSDTWVVSSSASGISSPNRKSLTSIGREAVLFSDLVAARTSRRRAWRVWTYTGRQRGRE